MTLIITVEYIEIPNRSEETRWVIQSVHRVNYFPRKIPIILPNSWFTASTRRHWRSLFVFLPSASKVHATILVCPQVHKTQSSRNVYPLLIRLTSSYSGSFDLCLFDRAELQVSPNAHALTSVTSVTSAWLLRPGQRRSKRAHNYRRPYELLAPFMSANRFSF